MHVCPQTNVATLNVLLSNWLGLALQISNLLFFYLRMKVHSHYIYFL
uniref:Uncharacterized protein n=1 Tax=Rhizophora mucronata TaxID=61149 RepID=A0A2P2ILG8_RHIMU